MITLNITDAQATELTAVLKASHQIRIIVTVYTASEVALSTLEAITVLEGEITYDVDQDVSRSLSLKLVDTNHELAFDKNSPAEDTVFADNVIGVEYGVWLPLAKIWVDIPVFRGPITGFTREGVVVTIEAQGKESLALEPHYVTTAYSIPKGTTVAAAVKRVITKVGEASSKCLLDNVQGRLNAPRAISKGEIPWKVIVGGDTDSGGKVKPALMNKASNRPHLFYNGRGELTAKGKVTNSVWTFDKAQVLSDPSYSYDVIGRVKNVVDVTGGTPKKSKKHFHAKVSLAKVDPFSPSSLARNGVNREMVLFISSDSLKSDAACKKRGNEALKENRNQILTASFETLPNPLLEEMDTITLDMTDYRIDFPLKQWTLPLVPDASMSVGFTKDTSRSPG